MKTDVNVDCWPPEPKAVRSNRAGRTTKFRHLQEYTVSAFLFFQPYFQPFCGKWIRLHAIL